ncbi:MAG TPA: hypothetical protein VJ851_13720 [Jatrophihabitans sp.]|nr:hypothetical protein [Jatrophihabitans sp.]
MTHTEDDLRAALRLLEQRTPIPHPPAVAASARASRVRWAAPVLVAAAVVAAVAVSTAVITTQGTAGHSSRQQTQPAGPGGSSTAVSTPRAGPKPVALPGPLALNPTWLPAAGQQVTASIGYGSEFRGYNMHVDGFELYVLLSLSNATGLPTDSKRGTPVDLTVAGHPAREWAVNYWYTLAVQINPHQVVTVDLEDANETGANATAANLTTMGRHIATALRTDGNDTLTPYYSLTYLPAGTVVASVDRNGPLQGSNYQLAPAQNASTSRPNLAAVNEVVGDPAKVHGGPAEKAQPGQPVQGHQTIVRRINGGYGLTVLNFRPNVSIDLYTGLGATTLTELYRIAEGIQWNG